MHMGHEIDMVVDRGIHLIWRSHYLNIEGLWSGKLYVDHVPGGVVIKVGEHSCINTYHIREHDVECLVHHEDLRIEKK
jgi:hypothetical protein